MAAVLEFSDSELFPSQDDQHKCIRTTGSHTEIFLERFKNWLQQSRESSVSFRYRSQMFLLYGPLLELFDLSTKHCWGKARKACYILQLPMYAQLGFKNYYSECFIHVMNFLGKWPLAFRHSIHLSGCKGDAIELDAFVEAEIVQPLKVYMSGKEVCYPLEELITFHNFVFFNLPREANKFSLMYINCASFRAQNSEDVPETDGVN